jgi:ERCC4-type nuclease
VVLVDPRDGNPKQGSRSKEMCAIIQRIGIPAQLARLPYGDFAFEGRWEDQPITVGVELKTLHDMLNCIDDSRYSASQKIGMGHLYQASYLIVEGIFKPHDPSGILMEGFQNGTSWGECRYRSSRVQYSKLRRYLLSVGHSGVHVLYTRDIVQTCWDVAELYQYYQKKNHTSMLQTQLLSVPGMDVHPPLVRRWAADIDGIGTKHSLDAEHLFKVPINLARASESDWLRIEGIGPKTAIKIVRQVNGWDR